jgi:hypothetical protein
VSTFWKQAAAVATSFIRSFVLGCATLIVTQGWGIFAAAENWRMVVDAGFVALAMTVYLFLDRGFTQYGVGYAESHALTATLECTDTGPDPGPVVDA